MKAVGRTGIVGACIAEATIAAICEFLCSKDDVLEQFREDPFEVK